MRKHVFTLFNITGRILLYVYIFYRMYKNTSTIFSYMEVTYSVNIIPKYKNDETIKNTVKLLFIGAY